MRIKKSPLLELPTIFNTRQFLKKTRSILELYYIESNESLKTGLFLILAEATYVNFNTPQNMQIRERTSQFMNIEKYDDS